MCIRPNLHLAILSWIAVLSLGCDHETATVSRLAEGSHAGRVESNSNQAIGNTTSTSAIPKVDRSSFSDKYFDVAATIQSTIKDAPNSFVLAIDIKIATGWHVYAMDNAAGPNFPMRVDLQVPDGFELSGDWIGPKPEVMISQFGTVYVHHNQLRIEQRLVTRDHQPVLPSHLACDIHLQACNQHQCLPPQKISLLVPFPTQ